MVVLRKLTLAYSALEDRIQMRCESDKGTVISMWLSLRLCREMVKVLTRLLESSQVAYTPVAQNALVQRSLHGQAKTRLRPQKPVADSDAGGFLLTQVSVKLSGKRILLKVAVPEAEQAVIPLSLDEARQWLELLFQQYKKAEWPLDAWPEWIRNNSPELPSQVINLH